MTNPLNLSPDAIKLLRKVKRKILRVPEAFDMKDWVKPSRTAPCGTAACIAGWCAIYSLGLDKQKLVIGSKDPNWDLPGPAPYLAAQALGQGSQYEPSPHGGFHILDKLFYERFWPKQFGKGFKGLPKPEKAKRAAARIEWFIKKGE